MKYGAYLRGTGKIFIKLPMVDENGKKIECHVTHCGQIQAQVSVFMGEWSPAHERANEIERGAPLTNEEKADKKERAKRSRLENRIIDLLGFIEIRKNEVPLFLAAQEKRAQEWVKTFGDSNGLPMKTVKQLEDYRDAYIKDYEKEIAKIKAKLGI